MIVPELKHALTGGIVQKIHQPSEREVMLVIRSVETHMLFLSVNTGFFRVHLVKKKPKNPVHPFSFCQFLRKYLTGFSLSSIFQVKDDRVLSFVFRGRDKELHLWVELFGRNSNLFITDGEQRILQKLVKKGRDDRGVLEYSLTPEKEEQGKEKVRNNQDESPSSLKWNRQAEEIYGREERQFKTEKLRNRVLSELQKRAAKLTVRKKKIMEDSVSLEKWKSYLTCGELLKHNLSMIKKGMKRVHLEEYPGAVGVSILLDPSLTPQQNMMNYFSRYKKSIRGQKKIEELLKEAELEMNSIFKKIQFFKTATAEELSAAGGNGGPKRPATPHGKQEKRSQPHTFTSASGLSILVGKGSVQNEEITFKIAKGNDLWFHVRGVGGAHVVLQMKKLAEAPQESILDAASLALFYSKLKPEGKGEVTYTYKKYLKKPKGAKPGLVQYTRDKNIFVHLESTRMDRLMRSKKS
ncbi:MAG: NFACT family protein [Nitrospinota bacterium]